MLRIFYIKYFYTCDNLAETRGFISKQICFRPILSFVKYRKCLTNSISNRLVYRSQFYRSYIDLRQYYIYTLRANFCAQIAPNYAVYDLRSNNSNLFLNAYTRFRELRDFDNALLWRANNINSLFSLKLSKKIKRKQIHYTKHAFFLPSNKRLLFVWRWLAVSIKCGVVNSIPRKFSLISGFENFLGATKDNHTVTKFKFQVYKMHAVHNV